MKMMKKYSRRYSAAFIAYLVLTLIMIVLRNPEAPFGFLWGLLPIVPFLVMLHYLLKIIKESDEMERKIIMESFAFSALATSTICFAYDTFGGYGLPEFQPVWAFWMIWGFLGIGMMRYWKELF